MRHRLTFRSSCSSAFTLIELLVVIVILGILMAVAVPTFLSQQNKAQDSKTEQYLTTAFKAIRAGLPGNNEVYPQSTSMVSWITSSEPELTAKRGDCLTGVTSAPVDAVLVDPSSTPTSLQLCARSQSGNVWKLTASATGAQQLLDGTLVPLTVSGNEITDATRAADVQGDGLSTDSSTGIWEGTTNLVPNGGFESNTTGWSAATANSTLSTDSSDSVYGARSGKATAIGAGAGFGFAYYNLITGAPVAQKTYTLSLWFKGTAGKPFQIQLNETGGADGVQVVGGTAIVYPTATGSWQHVVMTGTVQQPDRTSLYVLIQQTLGTGVNAGDSFLVDGVQVEQKAIATPYVETNGTTATRAAARVQAPAALLNAAQGWAAMRVRLHWTPTQRTTQWPGFFAWSDPAGSNFMLFYYNPPGNGFYFKYGVGGAVQVDQLVASYAASDGSVVTLIAQWSTSQVAGSASGAPFTWRAIATPLAAAPAASFDIGNNTNASAGNTSDADFLWFACGTGTLTNADAATINSWGDTDPTRSSFPSAAQATMTWNGAGSAGSLK